MDEHNEGYLYAVITKKLRHIEWCNVKEKIIINILFPMC